MKRVIGKASVKLLLYVLLISAALLSPSFSSALSCHSACEDAMMVYFEDCERKNPGDHCTNDAHTFFCGCMAGCSGEPTPECPAN